MALMHSAVCYLSSPSVALKQFSGPQRPQPTGLSARVYGVKNVYTGLIRVYAAYHVTNPQLYALAQWTFAGVLFLYLTELFVYRTARLKECAFPFVFAGSAMVWTVVQRGFYLGN
ncbi:hypothetical protein QBC35DRAFT_508631 [Podospora australis]|uniref:Ergosterol biosynthesis protein n=1 Tax=Podospora australis TaxID=1536484 RepID=A0AAN6WKW0_9PEZI|nr:hypothetical protein QBC35DRAFT_508631 [Podospora australis]